MRGDVLDTVQVAVGEVEVARPGSSRGDDDGVVRGADLSSVVSGSDCSDGRQLVALEKSEDED
jgi:hypothetical protein